MRFQKLILESLKP